MSLGDLGPLLSDCTFVARWCPLKSGPRFDTPRGKKCLGLLDTSLIPYPSERSLDVPGFLSPHRCTGALETSIAGRDRERGLKVPRPRPVSARMVCMICASNFMRMPAYHMKVWAFLHQPKTGDRTGEDSEDTYTHEPQKQARQTCVVLVATRKYKPQASEPGRPVYIRHCS